MAHRVRLLPVLLAALAAAGCPRPPPAPCPPEPAIAALHAAAFFFQAGDLGAGAARLQAARALLAGPAPTATTAALLEGLTRLSALSPAAGDERAHAAERLRLALSEWECLPPALHEALHRDLPPLPGPGG